MKSFLRWGGFGGVVSSAVIIPIVWVVTGDVRTAQVVWAVMSVFMFGGSFFLKD